MPITTPHRIAAVALLTAAVGMSACSSSSKSSSKSTAATTAPTVAPTTTAASTATTVDPALEAAAKSSLLVPADVGTGFTAGTYTPKDPKQPQACGQPSIDSKYPPILKVGTEIDQAQSLQLNQDLVFYPDQATSDAALADGIAGISCPTGTFYATDGTTTTAALTGPTDVTAQVGGTKADEWTLKGDQFQGVLIVVQGKTAITAFSFIAGSAADAANAPDPIAVAKKGVDKLKAGLASIPTS